MTWKREYDRRIAVEVEGHRMMDDEHVDHRDHGGEAGWHDRVPLDNYSRSDAATERALRAWVDQDVKDRAASVNYCRRANREGKPMLYEAILYDSKRSETFPVAVIAAPTIALAGSAALLRALGGVK